MTDMTQSTELQAFKRPRGGYKVTVKISLCICVVLSWDELKVRQNLLDSDYEMYMVRLLVATVNWHKSLQFVKKSNITLLPCLFMILLAVSIIILRLGITFWQELRFCVVFSPPSFVLYASHAIIDTDTSKYLPRWIESKILKYLLSSLIVVSAAAKQLKAGFCFNATEIFSTQTGEQSVMLWEQKILEAFYMISEWVLYKNEFIPVATQQPA